jgi:hypothetical protein
MSLTRRKFRALSSAAAMSSSISTLLRSSNRDSRTEGEQSNCGSLEALFP